MIISDLSKFESHVQDLLKVLPGPDVRSALVDVDLMPLFFRMTLDSASETLLGGEMAFHSQLDAPGSESMRFMDAFDFIQNRIHRRNIIDRGWGRPLGIAYSLYKGTGKDKFEQACETVQSIIDAKLLDFLRRPVKKIEEDRTYVFLEEMARTTRDPLELRYEILNVLMAGRDTTAALLTNTLFVLARRPDLWSRVRAEVEETFAGQLPDYKSLRNMKQLRNLLNECE
jgi:cytochrome P450